MANRNDVIEVEVLGWEKNNPSKKKGHTHFMLSQRFFDDHKIATLTPVERLLFIAIIARCASECAPVVKLTASQLRAACGLTYSGLIPRIAALERNQLVRLAKPLPNRIEKKRIEKKRKENKGDDFQNRVNPAPENGEASRAPAVAVVPLGQDLIATYFEVYRTRYSTDPVIKPADAKNLKSFGESNGREKTKELLAAYLKMQNSWFITKSHDLATFLSNLNQIKNFVATGQVVTLQDARNLESEESLKNQIKRLAGGL